VESRYRDDAEVSRHWSAEPLARLRNYLVATGNWDRDKQEALQHDCSKAVEQAAAEYLATPPAPLSAMFDYT
jgi:pyruvate dehydrogenase E1 component alpha subunit